ncbi:uncharacterized protein C8Q71DRAFT_135378 [Rhodofomes roseus]|uniref:Uncharacterized protein n=1 Tax=Rhodofomes roseus TaxID=34475 RepID=A0ABQ8KC28_9APHY|nr:uncharacterized protein C8Q71DRAFT_135378 [Rhodofomes roseus]KAH9834987.1 hypothetical protein C8Q71DRAFT_135378 [Rhodofomes roseus]
MASTLTTESRSSLRQRRPAVPLLLSSFPLPPSHIPSTSSLAPSPSPPVNLSASPIATHVNPPPSRPPSTPLPPVPGPSPVSKDETHIFITAARSRRTSKMSLNSMSSYSRRSSTASSASVGNSLPSLSPSVSITPGGESTRSLRSYPSNGSLAAPTSWRGTMTGVDKSPVLDSKICEEDPADLTRMSLDEIHAAELSDDEKGLERIGESVLKEHSHRKRGHRANDSISSIDMRDLPPLNEREDEIAISVPKIIPSPKKKLLDKNLPPLPTEEPRRAGAESPDILQILATTPRPRRKSSGCPSRSASRTRVRSLRRHVSDGTALTSSRSRKTSEDSFVADYGSPLDATGTPIDVVDVEEEERLDRALDGEGSDTDSEIDIHTPLPNLMLRDGLLSPNSKLLPQAQPIDDRPSSHMSIVSNAGSVMTKSGLFKDERDTVHRRVRHRDGKLLRGGIGLTTGLGWSDSEDEGAPSPLTRQLSSNTLGRKSLPATLRSSTSTSSSLSRHYTEMEERRPRASLPSDLSRKPSMSSISVPRSSLSSMRSMPSSSRLSARGSHYDEMPRAKTPLSAPPGSRVSGLPAVRRLERSSSDMDAVYKSDPAPRAMQRASSSSSRTASMRSTLSQSTSSTSAGQTAASRLIAPPTAWAGGRPIEVPRPLKLPQGHSSAGIDDSRRRSDGTDKSRLSAGSNVSASTSSSRSREPTQVPPSPALRGATMARAPSAGPDGKAKPRTGTGMVYRSAPHGTASRPTMMRTPSSTKLRAAYQTEVGIAT